MIKHIKKFITDNFLLIYNFYFLTLFLDSTSLEVDYPTLEIIVRIIRYIVYILLFIRLILILPDYKNDICEIEWKEKKIIIKFLYILIGIMCISLLINFVTTTNKRLLFLVLIIISSYRVDYKKIINNTMNLQIILTSIVVLLSVLGMTQNYIVPRGSIERSSLGFNYTTNLAQMVLFSSVIYIYNIGTEIEWNKLFIIQLLNSFTFFITDSRSEFIILEGIAIVTIVLKVLRKSGKDKIIRNIKKIYSSIFSYTFVVYPLLSFIAVLCYKFGGIWNKLNVLLSNRLKQTYDNITLYGINPFGDKIEFIGLGLRQKMKYGSYSSNYVDNEYIQIMFNEGFIFAIGFILMLSVLLILLCKNKKYREVLLCSIYLIFGLINPRIINLLYCPILFMIIPTVLEYKNGVKTEIQNE